MRILSMVSANRKRVLPGLVALALLAGLIVSVVASNNAHADYYTGCGYGYGSSSSDFGYGTGYGYGYLNGSTIFGYGYGNQVCPLAITTSSPLPSGTQYVAYSPVTFQGAGGTGSYTWSGSAPFGLTFSGGVLSGTPTSSGTSSFSVTMTDGNGQTLTKSFSITVAPAAVTTTTTAPPISGGGGVPPTTTTTVAPTTTTTLPTTTTTATPPPLHRFCWFHAIRFNGVVLVGRSVTRTIVGQCFYAQPRVTSDEPGTRIGVLHDNGRVLVVRVTVRAGSQPGWHTLTIREPNGKTCKVNYLVKK